MVEKYGDKVRIIYRDYPLPSHGRAQAAAEAARCAHAQGKFWAYHDKIFENLRGSLDADQLKGFAAELGLDADPFAQCLDSNEFAEQVQASARSGQALGVTGTPAFFINGRFLGGAKPFEAFVETIDEELAR
ncbi:MAG: thioredoxin domain-containing protein [bacterium]|nr:thioredoxin domain-containing protein [bacterium]